MKPKLSLLVLFVNNVVSRHFALGYIRFKHLPQALLDTCLKILQLFQISEASRSISQIHGLCPQLPLERDFDAVFKKNVSYQVGKRPSCGDGASAEKHLGFGCQALYGAFAIRQPRLWAQELVEKRCVSAAGFMQQVTCVVGFLHHHGLHYMLPGPLEFL